MCSHLKEFDKSYLLTFYLIKSAEFLVLRLRQWKAELHQPNESEHKAAGEVRLCVYVLYYHQP